MNFLCYLIVNDTFSVFVQLFFNAVLILKGEFFIMLKGVVLGGYLFTSKKGNECIKITVEDKHSDSFGTCADSVILKKESLPVGLKELIGKSVAVDSRNGFGSDLFIVK